MNQQLIEKKRQATFLVDCMNWTHGAKWRKGARPLDKAIKMSLVRLGLLVVLCPEGIVEDIDLCTGPISTKELRQVYTDMKEQRND